MAAPEASGSAEDDYAAVRPAALAAATAGCPLVVAWLSRGDGTDLELITKATPAPAAPVRRGKHAAPGPVASGAEAHGTAGAGGGPPLFPPGARAEPATDRAAELAQLVWAPCLAVPESPPEPPPGAPPGRAEPAEEPGVFETALIALMRRPFGWLMVAEPTDLLAAETAGLRTELDILRRHHERRASGAVEQTERRLADRGTFGAAGLWRVQVLAGASTADELDVLAPLLAGATELGPHPYRLRHTAGAHALDAALAARHHDPADGAQSPFFVTAGTLTALAGLPRASVPGLELVHRPGPGPVSDPAGDDRATRLLTAPAAAPAANPAAPANGPEPPAAHPETPVASLETPAAHPEPPAAHPEPPVPGPETAAPGAEPPAVGPETPALGPEPPVAGLETPAAPMVTTPWAVPDLNGLENPSSHERHSGNGSHNSQNGSARPDTEVADEPEAPAEPDSVGTATDGSPAGPVSPATRPSTNNEDDPFPADPVPDLTGRLVELGAPAEAGGEPVRVPMSRLRGGVLVAGCAGSGTSRTVRQLLAQATEAGLPWLLVDPAGPGHPGLPATVINPVDPDGVPMTFSPLALAPGCPLPAHLALAGSLLDVALGADERLSLLVTQALRQAYQTAGWDLVTGRPSDPARLPDLCDLHTALRQLIARSGYGRAAQARLRGIVDTRFGSWLDGPAGRFLADGHPVTPADLSELLRRRVVLATRDLADVDRAMVTGALLIRLAGHLRTRGPAAALSLIHI